MAKAPSRKLKVFQAQFDTVVAAPSQAAALRAWGTHQNLFASGEATVATDRAAVSAAIAHPETPLRRAIGSTDAFALEPTSLPKVPDAPKKAAAKALVKAKHGKPPRLAADRSKLDSAEKILAQIDDRRKREEAAFRQEEQDLETRRVAAQEAYVEARKGATAEVVDARAAYREAGGAD